MSFADQITKFIEDYPDLFEAGDPATEEQIEAITEYLGFDLSPELKTYLLRFGTLTIWDYFFGVAGELRSSCFCIVGRHELLVADLNMDPKLVAVQSEEGDSYLVLAPTRTGDRVFRWVPGGTTLHDLEQTFGERLVEQCEELIEDEGDLED